MQLTILKLLVLDWSNILLLAAGQRWIEGKIGLSSSGTTSFLDTE